MTDVLRLILVNLSPKYGTGIVKKCAQVPCTQAISRAGEVGVEGAAGAGDVVEDEEGAAEEAEVPTMITEEDEAILATRTGVSGGETRLVAEEIDTVSNNNEIREEIAIVVVSTTTIIIEARDRNRAVREI